VHFKLPKTSPGHRSSRREPLDHRSSRNPQTSQTRRGCMPCLRDGLAVRRDRGL